MVHGFVVIVCIVHVHGDAGKVRELWSWYEFKFELVRSPRSPFLAHFEGSNFPIVDRIAAGPTRAASLVLPQRHRSYR